MIGIRWMGSALGVLLLLAGGALGGPGFFSKKARTEAQIKRFIETLRTDTDEQKRRAALASLAEADPRQFPDIIPALIVVLQKDASPRIRSGAAETIGQYRIVYSVAGLALEAAAELDPAKSVRQSAQEALWEYHLAGYRSLRGVGGIAGQTSEPPVAPKSPQPAVAPAGVSVSITVAPPSISRRFADLPPLAPRPQINRPIHASRWPRLRGPVRSYRPNFSPIALLRSALPKAPSTREPTWMPPPLLTLTVEPPIAAAPALAVAPMPRDYTPLLTVVQGDPIELPVISSSPNWAPSGLQNVAMPKRWPFQPSLPGPRVRIRR